MQMNSSNQVYFSTIVKPDYRLRHLLPSQQALEFGLADFIFSTGEAF